MIRKEMLLIMVILTLSAAYLFADQWNTGNTNPYMNLNGILNPANLRMNHTMSFLTSASSDGRGYYQSVYTNHMFYKFHPKVDFQLDLNFVNFGTASWNDNFSLKSNNDNASRVVPEFTLQYRPSDNTSIRIEFRSMGPFERRNDWWW